MPYVAAGRKFLQINVEKQLTFSQSVVYLRMTIEQAIESWINGNHSAVKRWRRETGASVSDMIKGYQEWFLDDLTVEQIIKFVRSVE